MSEVVEGRTHVGVLEGNPVQTALARGHSGWGVGEFMCPGPRDAVHFP